MLTKELIVFFSAMTPGLDLKIAIPIGLGMGLSLTTTLLFAIPGMTVPGAVTLAVLGPLSKWAMKKSQKLNNFLTKLFKKTRSTHSKN
ncbi:MAG: small multi-drug export protein, partial [Patescibacteria group bacterium]